MPMTTPIAPARRPAAARVLLAAGLGLALLVAPACKYNGHRTMGATEKLVASDVNHVAKIGGTFFVSLGDSILAPAEMLVDQVVYDPQYVPEHKYFSYAGSRTIARSDMGLGYQWMSSIWSVIIETLYLPITGTVDLVGILAFGDDEPPPVQDDLLGKAAN
jgi:hypothetical protein